MAQQAASSRSPAPDVKSPCVNICEMDARKEYCRGCLRTIDEIFNWPTYTSAEKIEVLERVAQRQAKVSIEKGMPSSAS